MAALSRLHFTLRIAAAACLVGAAVTSAAAQTAAPDPVVAKVNGAEIRQSDVRIAEDEIGGSIPQDAQPEQRREYALAYLIDMTIMAQDAESQGLSSDDEFKRRFQQARNKALMETLLRQIGTKAVTEEAMRKTYDDAVKAEASGEEVHARHILVKEESEAKAIAEEIKKGADFVELAEKKSIEPGAAESGGDLGYFTKEQMVPEFSEAAFKLEKGQVSDPVKSQFGWHIIKSEDKRSKAPPPYELVKMQLQAFVSRKAQSDYVNKLRTAAKVERTEPPKPAAGATPPGGASTPPGAAATPPNASPVPAPPAK